MTKSFITRGIVSLPGDLSRAVNHAPPSLAFDSADNVAFAVVDEAHENDGGFSNCGGPGPEGQFKLRVPAIGVNGHLITSRTNQAGTPIE